MFADAGSLGDAAKILKNDYLSKDRLWASWGDYDRRQFERVCKDQDVGYPFGPSHLKREGTLDPMQTLQWKRGSVFEVLSANLSSRSVSGDGNPNNPGGASCETRTTKTSTNSHFFETMSKRRKAPKRIEQGPSETQVKRGERIVHGDKVLEEKLGSKDLCPCGSGQRFKKCCLRKGCF